MKITVDFYNENNDDIGTLIWDGKDFSWKHVEEEWLKKIINNDIHIGDVTINPKRDPEKYMRNLCLAYRSAYFNASKPIIHK